MAHAVFLDPRFVFNSVDLSDHVTDEGLSVSTTPVSDVAGGDTFEAFMAGLRKFGGTVSGYQDYAAGEVDATIFAAWLARSAVAVTMGPDKTSAISTSNPEYQFSAFVAEYQPIQGRIGEASKFSLTLSPTTDLTRDVTP
jgi:hypothetical protein